MKNKALFLLACQQACFIGGLAACIMVRPSGLAANGGISYYGIFTDTFPYYMVAMLGTAVFSLLGGRVVSVPSLWPLRRGLYAIAGLTAVIAFTPYFLSIYVDLAHTLAGIIMFVIQLAMSIWILARLRWSRWALAFVSLEAAAGIVSVMYVLPSHGFLIQGQIGFQLAFAGVLLNAFRGLLPE